LSDNTTFPVFYRTSVI